MPATGSLLWGQMASWVGVREAVFAAAAFGMIVLLLTRKHSVEGGADIDFTPAPPRSAPSPIDTVAADEGPVMVTLEYQIDPTRAADFAEVMQRTRRARLRQGALSWGPVPRRGGARPLHRILRRRKLARTPAPAGAFHGLRRRPA